MFDAEELYDRIDEQALEIEDLKAELDLLTRERDALSDELSSAVYYAGRRFVDEYFIARGGSSFILVAKKYLAQDLAARIAHNIEVKESPSPSGVDLTASVKVLR